MVNTAELQNRASRLRFGETVTRALGCLAAAGGTFATAVIAGEVAHGGFEAVTITGTATDIISVSAAVGALMYSSSLGRRADVVDTELLRREAPDAHS